MSLAIICQDPREGSLFAMPDPKNNGGWIARMVRALWSGLHRLITAIMRLGEVVGHWLRREIWDALLCVLTVYLGVLSTVLLPAALLPVPAQVALSPLAALPIAVFVADRRAYRRWRGAGAAPLGVRLLRAGSDGVLWWCWWRAL